MIGITGKPGSRSASASFNSGRIGSIIAWWEATSTFTRRANLLSSPARATTASTASTGPATTVWRGDAYTATVTPGKSAMSDSVAAASISSRAIAPLAARLAINCDRLAITRNPSAGVSAPATTAAVTSPIE